MSLPKETEEFAEIGKYWDFNRLCKDLTNYKAKQLTPHEIQILKGLLLSYGPKEIKSLIITKAPEKKKGDKNKKSCSISVTISRVISPLIRHVIEEKLELKIKKINRERIPIWLERSGYRTAFMYSQPTPAPKIESGKRIAHYANGSNDPPKSLVSPTETTPVKQIIPDITVT
jgi:hypothetical protein